MEYGKAFTYVFDDEEWIMKIVIGGIVTLFSFLLIPIPLLVGYMIQVIQNVARGDPKPLPAWSNMGALFVKGLKWIVVAIVYALPLILIVCLTTILSLAVGGDRRTADTLLTTVSLLTTCCNLIWSLFMTVVMPSAMIRFSLTENIGAAFQFGEVFRLITSNLGNYIIVIILGWVASFVAMFGFILCLIGVIFTTFWAVVVTGHLYGQLGRLYQSTAPAAA